MNVVLWVLQVLLALAFAAHAWMMLFPSPEIAAQMNANLPRWFSLFIGVAEAAAAIGLILPGLTRIMPFFVTWAAVGIDDHHGVGQRLSRRPRRVGRHGDDLRPAADGGVPRVWAAAAAADSRPRRRLTVGPSAAAG